MVHGNCVSIGCYAMGDAAIEEIYTLMGAAFALGVRDVPVHAFPFRFDRIDAARAAGRSALGRVLAGTQVRLRCLRTRPPASGDGRGARPLPRGAALLIEPQRCRRERCGGSRGAPSRVQPGCASIRGGGSRVPGRTAASARRHAGVPVAATADVPVPSAPGRRRTRGRHRACARKIAARRVAGPARLPGHAARHPAPPGPRSLSSTAAVLRKSGPSKPTAGTRYTGENRTAPKRARKAWAAAARWASGSRLEPRLR
jgi:hypothetical protein